MITDARPSTISDIPRAFCCSETGKLMRDPVLALCGHLFERSVVDGGGTLCPHDKNMVREYVSCAELKELIRERYPKTVTSSVLKHSVLRKFPNVIYRAHDDDIHGIIKLSSGKIVTGSKDGSVKIWNSEGKSTKKIGGSKDYRYWITAMESLSNGSWASGTRDGFISYWDSDGKEIFKWKYDAGYTETYSKARNRKRICCLSQAKTERDGQLHLYSGTVKDIHLWDLNTKSTTPKLLRSYQSHSNDWVYCIDPITTNKILVVTGPILECWTLQSEKKFERSTLIRWNKRLRRSPQFISAISRIETDPNILVTASFDGKIKVFDLKASKVVRCYEEHVGRAWCIAKVNEQYFATGADDKIIRIWDRRLSKAAATIKGHPGRVSAIINFQPNFILSGSCPDDPHSSETKAQLNLYDLRRNSSSKKSLKFLETAI